MWPTIEAADEQVPGDLASDEPGSASEGEASEQELVDEGDIAADYIEELLDIADLDGDIDIDARAGRAYVSVTASAEIQPAACCPSPTPSRRCRSSPGSRCRTAPVGSRA